MKNEYHLNVLTPELLCSDIKASLNFYTVVLDFQILYQRKAEGFAMLEREGAQIMLDQNRPGNWVSAKLEHPYGRGMNLQIETSDVKKLYNVVQQAGADIFLPLEDKCYKINNTLLNVRQFAVLDPDGYMLRFFDCTRPQINTGKNGGPHKSSKKHTLGIS